MNMSEFKAWFEGFTESMDGPPGEKAWKRVCDRVKSIKNDEPTTRHVFHDYYERPWRRWYTQIGDVYPMHSAVGLAAQSSLNAAMPLSQLGQISSSNAAVGGAFDSHAAFARLGAAEALSMKG